MSIWTMEISDFEGVVQAGVTVPEGSSGTTFLLWTRAYGPEIYFIKIQLYVVGAPRNTSEADQKLC